ncbi:MAG: hypothetical protein JO091_02595 [Acidobacteriaceae bacterium]|nr:hypothetical protein [Acidobacteriaceae bacterium]
MNLRRFSLQTKLWMCGLAVLAPLLSGQTSALPENGQAQSKTNVGQQSSADMPMIVLYKHFFAHLRQLDEQPQTRQTSGKSGAAYKSY